MLAPVELPIATLPKGLKLSEPEPGVLQIRWHWWSANPLGRVAMVLALLACDVGFFLLERWILVEMNSLAPAFMTAFFFGLPLVALHYGELQAALTHSTLRVTSDQLLLRWGPYMGGERVHARNSVKQLWALGLPRGVAAVCVAFHDGKRGVLARHLNPTQARFIEQLLERELGVVDRQVGAELPREAELLKQAHPAPWRSVLLASVAIGALGFGGYFATQPLSPTSGASLLDRPARAIVQVQGGQTVELWVAVAVDGAPLTHHRDWSHLRGLVHLDVTVQEPGGGTRQLRCDPLHSSFMDWSDSTKGLSDMAVSFVGRMDGCSVRASSAGSMEIEARLERSDEASALVFERLELVVR